MKKKILLYIQVPFMDVNLELIKIIKTKFDVHVIIELPSTMMHANIFDLTINLSEYEPLTSYWDVAEKWGLGYLKEYFEGCLAVNFAVYKPGSKKGLFITTAKMVSYINSQNFDYLQFDDFSARQAFILPFVKLKGKLILNIHDPIPHKGEFEWKRFIIRKLFYNKASSYITFSDYSKNELQKRLPVGSNVLDLRLMPYTVFQKFRASENTLTDGDMHISFVGRLSPYKGVDLFIDAIPTILNEFPDQQFLIAGRPTFGYVADFSKLGEAVKSVKIIDRHLSNEEMVNIISGSKLIVCPYLEATQSGVIMTAHALGCPVLVTNTGGLAESVIDNQTGLITSEITSEALANKILEFLRLNLYQNMHDCITNQNYLLEIESKNLSKISSAYA